MESTAAATPPEAQGDVTAGRQAPAGHVRIPTEPERPSGGSAGSRPAGPRWRRRSGEASPAPPWRVEGAPDAEQNRAAGRRGWSRFWMVLLALLIVNWVISSLLMGAASRTNVSYSFFISQVDSRNV